VANVPESWQGYVKICGVTSVEDAAMVANAGASALGLIFAESPRRVSIDQAVEIARATRGRLLRCAVFRHDTNDFILEHLDGLGAQGIDVVQLHGDLDDELRVALRERSLAIVKALNIEAEEFDHFDETSVDAVLVDGATPGSGQPHSWERLGTRRFRVPVIAAGGLNPDSVEAIVRSTGVTGADCASGVETRPGVKDPELVARFILNARRALASAEAS
jgi:phosphoribosylanthranilate isomerase